VPPLSQDQTTNQDKTSSQDQIDTQDDISWIEDGDMVVVATKTTGELLIPVEDHFKDANGSEAITQDSDGKEDKPNVKTLVGSALMLTRWCFILLSTDLAAS